MVMTAAFKNCFKNQSTLAKNESSLNLNNPNRKSVLKASPKHAQNAFKSFREKIPLEPLANLLNE